MLTREQILGADDLPREKVEVPEWGGSVYVRTMTAAERDAFEQSLVGDGNTVQLSNVRARLAALTMVDVGGKRLFSDADVEALGQKSAAALTRIVEVAQRLNRLQPDDIEDLAGN